MIVIKINYTSVAPIIKITYDETPIYVKTTYNNVYSKVSYGVATWGEIVGTLSDQTDLQNALDGKVPYTGATANVDLGEYELKAGQLTLDISPTGTAAVGTTRWNNTLGSSETTLKGGSVILKNGVDLVARIVNKVTPNTTLTKAAYQAVRVSGAQGQRLAVELAQANNDNNSADTIGLVTETIATNQEGFIMTVGSLESINTTGSLQGETWSDGDVIYLSPTTAGALTNVKPVAPQHIIVIGYVEYAHQNNGKLYVKVMNGWELGELHDVNTAGAINGQILTYNSTNSIWEPKNLSAINAAPANSSSTGTFGEIRIDTNYIYICTATNTWKRVAIATW
jgi:nitrogen fixation protein